MMIKNNNAGVDDLHVSIGYPLGMKSGSVKSLMDQAWIVAPLSEAAATPLTPLNIVCQSLEVVSAHRQVQSGFGHLRRFAERDRIRLRS
jgi:hypothetical protein